MAAPGLSRRDRRWVTLTCVAAADSLQPIDDHVYAALNSGDIYLEEMLEFILQFAVYCGWPKASHFERVHPHANGRASGRSAASRSPVADARPTTPSA